MGLEGGGYAGVGRVLRGCGRGMGPRICEEKGKRALVRGEEGRGRWGGDFLRRAVRERPLTDGCQRGGDGSPRPRGEGEEGVGGAQQRRGMMVRGDFLEAGGFANGPYQKVVNAGGWVPACARTREGETASVGRNSDGGDGGEIS